MARFNPDKEASRRIFDGTAGQASGGIPRSPSLSLREKTAGHPGKQGPGLQKVCAIGLKTTEFDQPRDLREPSSGREFCAIRVEITELGRRLPGPGETLGNGRGNHGVKGVG